MSKRTQIATPYDPNNPNRNPNDLFQDENGSEHPPMTKVFIGKVKMRIMNGERGQNHLKKNNDRYLLC